MLFRTSAPPSRAPSIWSIAGGIVSRPQPQRCIACCVTYLDGQSTERLLVVAVRIFVDAAVRDTRRLDRDELHVLEIPGRRRGLAFVARRLRGVRVLELHVAFAERRR